MRPHFGLRDAAEVEVVHIEWPSGAVQELTNLTGNQILIVWEPPALKAVIQEDGACRLTITAEPNRPWRIQSSTDLKTWGDLAVVNKPNVTFDYADTASTATACRFYRVVAQ